MKASLRLFLIALPLAGSLCVQEAQARATQNSSYTRHVRASAMDRYPLGARDFYSQFADTRMMGTAGEVSAPAGLDLARQIDALAGGETSAASARASMALATPADTPRAAAREEAVPMSAPQAPASRYALPIAALGLMLFVARRRSVF